MNEFSHFQIGNFLCEYLKKHHGIYLNKKSFIFGNLLPDLTLSFLKRPHDTEHNTEYLQKKMQKLLDHQQKSVFFRKNYSMQLGIICHYYADFFCYAHNVSFTGDSFSHMLYEKSLHSHLQKKYPIIKNTLFMPKAAAYADAKTIHDRFCNLHMRYLSGKPTYDNDLIFTLLACVEAVTLITSSSITNESYRFPLYYTNLEPVGI